MLKTFNEARRDNCSFLFEKFLKVTTKMTKYPKFFNIQSFHAIFVQFSTELVDWNVEEGQQEKCLLSYRLSVEINAVFY